VAWTLDQGFEPVGVTFGPFEPLLAVLVIERLVRHWPANEATNERLRKLGRPGAVRDHHGHPAHDPLGG
jgi:hypothetical protein